MPCAPSIDPVKAAMAYNLAEAVFAKNEIARRTTISEASVRDILNKHGRWGVVAEKPVFAKLRAEQKLVLEASYRTSAAKFLERSMEEAKLEKASTYQLVIASSIALDKSQLLAGEPTEITASVNIHAIQGLDRLASILSQALMPASNDVPHETIEVEPQGNQEVKT